MSVYRENALRPALPRRGLWYRLRRWLFGEPLTPLEKAKRAAERARHRAAAREARETEEHKREALAFLVKHGRVYWCIGAARLRGTAATADAVAAHLREHGFVNVRIVEGEEYTTKYVYVEAWP